MIYGSHSAEILVICSTITIVSFNCDRAITHPRLGGGLVQLLVSRFPIVNECEDINYEPILGITFFLLIKPESPH